MRTAAEVAVHHAARVQERQPLGELQRSPQDCVHARCGLGVGGRPEQALVDGHLCIMYKPASEEALLQLHVITSKTMCFVWLAGHLWKGMKAGQNLI